MQVNIYSLFVASYGKLNLWILEIAKIYSKIQLILIDIFDENNKWAILANLTQACWVKFEKYY